MFNKNEWIIDFTVCLIEFFHLLLNDEIANEQMNHRMGSHQWWRMNDANQPNRIIVYLEEKKQWWRVTFKPIISRSCLTWGGK